MDYMDIPYSGGHASYRGTKGFSQQDVHAAQATGFGAAADDYAERGIDLNEELIANKPATFFFRMNSAALEGSGIYEGDVLVVDRSIRVADGKLVVAAYEGDLIVRYWHKNMHSVRLTASHPKFGEILVKEFGSCTVWGVVTWVIHKM